MDKHYKPEELAKSWGVALKTVYRIIKRGELNAIKVGKLIRVSALSVDQFHRIKVQKPGNQK